MLRPCDMNKWMRDLKEAMDFLSSSWDSSVTFLSSSEWDPGLLHVSKDWQLIQTVCLSAWRVFYLVPGFVQGYSAKAKVSSMTVNLLWQTFTGQEDREKKQNQSRDKVQFDSQQIGMWKITQKRVCSLFNQYILTQSNFISVLQNGKKKSVYSILQNGRIFVY